jgi:hypothetical protein
MSNQYEVHESDSNQDIAEAVMWAAAEHTPLVVTLQDGRQVRFNPIVEQ